MLFSLGKISCETTGGELARPCNRVPCNKNKNLAPLIRLKHEDGVRFIFRLILTNRIRNPIDYVAFLFLISRYIFSLTFAPLPLFTRGPR